MRAAPAPVQSAVWRDPAFWVVVVTALLLARVCNWYAELYHHNVLDDAYISFQYAKNLSMGRGLVFNPGELVEGYTNFLWVVLLAPLFALARAVHADPTRAAIGLNLTIAVGTLWSIYFVGRHILVRGWFGVAVALVLCTLDNGFQGYAVSGLENHLVALCMLAAMLAWSSKRGRQWPWAGTWLGLATLARPDAALFAVAFAIAEARDLARQPAGRQRSAHAARIGLALSVWAAITGAWFVWRFSYYGALLPNTFYLKVGSTFDAVGRGWHYTTTFLEDRYYVPLAALLALRWADRPAVRWLLSFIALHVAWIVYVGGDFYSGHRFYVAMLPAVYLLVGVVCDELLARIMALETVEALRSRTLLRAAAVTLASCAIGYGLFRFALRGMERGPYTLEILRWGRAVDDNVRLMKWLGTRVKPGESMVAGDIGSAGFLADVRVVDVLGVVDPEVAHAKVPGFGRGKPGHEKWASRGHLLARHPTYVKWPWIPGDLRSEGYYLFTDFPAGIDAEGLWVREDLEGGRFLPETAIHFEPSEMASWESTGDAFTSMPSPALRPGRFMVFGHAGSYVDSFGDGAGDGATGRLESPPFELLGDKLVLRVGGGRDPERLRVSLLVEGHRVGSFTGHGKDVLGRRVWDISGFRGRRARLLVEDTSTAAMGHILVDEVVQWERSAAQGDGR